MKELSFSFIIIIMHARIKSWIIRLPSQKFEISVRFFLFPSKVILSNFGSIGSQYWWSIGDVFVNTVLFIRAWDPCMNRLRIERHVRVGIGHKDMVHSKPHADNSVNDVWSLSDLSLSFGARRWFFQKSFSAMSSVDIVWLKVQHKEGHVCEGTWRPEFSNQSH